MLSLANVRDKTMRKLFPYKENHIYWSYGEGAKCDSCGKYHHLVRNWTAHFNVGYDWEDSMSGQDCFWCVLVEKYYHFKQDAFCIIDTMGTFIDDFCFGIEHKITLKKNLYFARKMASLAYKRYKNKM